MPNRPDPAAAEGVPSLLVVMDKLYKARTFVDVILLATEGLDSEQRDAIGLIAATVKEKLLEVRDDLEAIRTFKGDVQ